MPNTNAFNNDLLASLPPAARQAISTRLEVMELERGAVLYREGDVVPWAWFPLTGLLSLGRETVDAASQVAIVGKEGMAGLSSFIGGPAFSSCTILRGGTALRVSAADIAMLFEQHAGARHVLLAYAMSLLGEVAQQATCARHHSAQGQLGTLLLLAQDRLGDGELPFTHESLALLLGLRRETVTHAASMLQAAGIVRYRRGRIECLDRGALERVACGCYDWLRRGSVRQATRLLHDV